MRAFNYLWQEGPSTSQPIGNTPLSVDERDKGVAEDGYETGSDIDATELRMMK